MEPLKIVVLILVLVCVIMLPIFIWFFGKMLFHYKKMIFGINKKTYTTGKFILGPLLLFNKKYFEVDSQDSRIQFFKYAIKSFFSLIVLVTSYVAINVIKGL